LEAKLIFQQYWAVRRSKRINGTITPAAFFSAWRNIGLDLGTNVYTIVSVNAWIGSSGFANITFSGSG
jgi:endo-1,4-beta-xylanase